MGELKPEANTASPRREVQQRKAKNMIHLSHVEFYGRVGRVVLTLTLMRPRPRTRVRESDTEKTLPSFP